MKTTVSLKQNHLFRRLYAKGKSAVSPCVVVYCRKNGTGRNRLGLTVSTKLGNAVRRNKVRRRLRECYRIHEDDFSTGWDIVVVARTRASRAPYRELEASLLRLCGQLELLVGKGKQA